MGDTNAPSHETLFETAASQSGYFTTRQAHAAGFSDPLISHHAKRGRFVRVARGVYRLRDFPSVPREEIAAAWLAFAPNAAVSHESALDLLGLADIIPNAVHISVPRSRRNAPRIHGVAIHTTTKSLEGDEVISREGIRVTSATRTLVDVAEGGSAPDQVVAATQRAIRLGMTTPDRLREAVATMSPRSAALIRAGMPGPASTRYGSSEAFRRALEARLNTVSRTGGRSPARLRKEVVFDRLLARLVATASDRWVLKGGLALDYRFGDRARTTKDIDLAVDGDEATATGDLLTAQAADLGDFFIFTIERTPDLDPADDGAAIRYHVRAELAGRLFDEFILDVGFDPPDTTEALRGVDLLDFAGIEPVIAQAIPLESHIAEKLHAYTRTYGPAGRPSTRVKDLLDLVLISAEAAVDGRRMGRAIEGTFARRATHAVPERLPRPPREWRTPYAKLAKETGLPSDIETGFDVAAAFADPVLKDPSASRTWDPAKGRWSFASERPTPSTRRSR
jgi:hypothetical protein